SDAELELFRIHGDAQSKYTYYLLAVAAAAIAFSVTQTRTVTLTWHLLPVGLAVLAWGLSFYCGCCRVEVANACVFANAGLLRIERGQEPEIGMHPQYIAAAASGVRKAMDTHSNRASFFAVSQFRLLIGGGLLFLVWHVLEMYLRTITTP